MDIYDEELQTRLHIYVCMYLGMCMCVSYACVNYLFVLFK